MKLPLEMPEPNAQAPPKLIDKCLDVFLATQAYVTSLQPLCSGAV